jgi:Cof subfamily protein (haloacid dehalogenase superfamily)
VISGAQVRLVASDLDGTLLRSDLSVSDRTRTALGRAVAAGIRVVVVSARPPRWLGVELDKLGVPGTGICCNGAVVYDFERGVAVAHHPLAADLAVRLVERLRERAPGVAFACEDERFEFAREAGYVRLWEIGPEPPVRDALEFAAAPLTKLVAQHPELSQAELLAIAHEVCGDEAVATISGERLVELSAAGVTKAFALANLCAELGIGAGEVVAFGDMPNDVPMLEWAGRGVAVANAHPDALAAADEVTASNDEDGVALVLERLLEA